jgi:hypothetical protein
MQLRKGEIHKNKGNTGNSSNESMKKDSGEFII